MTTCDAVVVGGGPGGSTCAGLLRQAGWRVIVIDAARFPRDKVCAGWITPDVFRLLDVEPEEYRATGLTLQEIRGFRTGVFGGRIIDTRYDRIVSYAVRRSEFDDFLLRRVGIDVRQGVTVKTLLHADGRWVVNDSVAAPIVIGAGGHFCPVARHLCGGAERERPVVAREAEARVDAAATPLVPDVPELFFSRDLEGYGWCVRKGDYVNVGIGRRPGPGFPTHAAAFVEFLERTGRLAGAAPLRWRGHAYLAYGTGPRPLVGNGLLLVGDAAGLAYPESGEGIKPAIASGRLAADVLVAGGRGLDAAALRAYAGTLRRLYPPARGSSSVLRPIATAAGRRLLASPAFTRHVVLNRWFLRT